MATMLCLKIPCGSVCVHVELGEKGEVVVGGVSVLVSFDVLEGGVKFKFM
jgi:hypothetical protein